MSDTDRRIFALHEELAIAVKARRRFEEYLEDAGRTNDQLRATNRKLREENGRILQIVADWAHSSSEYGGLDSGDLIEDLRRAGHTLPDPTTTKEF
ncbi:hypothetical protein ABZ635_25970 [Nocardiopsis sp. NPDC007018]|uniref:hypothetical protein n=1 Tax=Nocardiopsis sp. NPDC007018 TaxID=3155721 RepID=UPI0033FC0AEF